MKKKYEDMSIGEGLITALEQAIEYEKGKKVPNVKTRTITIEPIPHYDAKSIKKIRNNLGVSQSTFAIIMGVSKKTVEAWESGRNEPQGPAQRILMLIEKDNNILKKYGLISNT